MAALPPDLSALMPGLGPSVQEPSNPFAPLMTGAPAEPPLWQRLSPETALHAELLTKLRRRIEAGDRHIQQRFDSWNRVDEHYRMYIDLTARARRSDFSIDQNEMEMPWGRSIAIPVTYSNLLVRMVQLQAALTSREPPIHIEGRGPEDVRPARVMETLLRYDLENMGFNLILWSLVQDVERYGCGIIYDSWHEEWGYVTKWPPPAPMADGPIGQFMASSLAEPYREFGLRMEGNKLVNVDPFKYIPDPGCPLGDPQAGEFVGHWSRPNYISLLEMSVENRGPYFNLEDARSHMRVYGETGYGRNVHGEYSDEGIGNDDDRLGVMEVANLQWKLIPARHGLGPSERPEIWQFSVANNTTIIRAHRLPYDHGRFCYSVAECVPDPHAPFTPGTGEHIEGLERFITWLINSHLQNTFTALNNQLVYSNEFIEEQDILNPGPAFHIRLTAEGNEMLRQGRPINSLYSQLQFIDITKGHMEDAQAIYQWTQRIAAANDVQQGLQLPSQRTLGEIQTIMQTSTQRILAHARLMDDQVIRRVASRMIANRQQLTTMEQYIRVTGDLAGEIGMDRIMVKPRDVWGNFDYIPHTPLMPQDPARVAEAWLSLLKVVGAAPQLMAPGPDGKAFNIRAAVNQYGQSLGIRFTDQLWEQVLPAGMPPQLAAMLAAGGGLPPVGARVVPDEQAAAAAEAGNAVPIPTGRR